MTTQGYGEGIDLNLSASGDLNGSQFRFVTHSSGGERKVIQSTGGCNPYPIGVLQNNPRDGEAARVRVFGETQLYVNTAASNIVYGAFLVSGSEGFGYPQEGGATGSAPVQAMVIGPGITTAGACNILVSVLLLGPAGVAVAAS